MLRREIVRVIRVILLRSRWRSKWLRVFDIQCGALGFLFNRSPFGTFSCRGRVYVNVSERYTVGSMQICEEHHRFLSHKSKNECRG